MDVGGGDAGTREGRREEGITLTHYFPYALKIGVRKRNRETNLLRVLTRDGRREEENTLSHYLPPAL